MAFSLDRVAPLPQAFNTFLRTIFNIRPRFGVWPDVGGTVTTLLWLTLATALTVIGDYLIKLSTLAPQGMRSVQFAMGALCYGLPAVAWFAMMRDHSLAAIAVFYSAATLVILAGMGVLIFKEPFSWREGLGVALALAAVLVVQSGE